MKIKNVLLPLMVGLASYAMTATAQSAKPAQQMGGKSMAFIENKGQVTDQFHSPRMDIDFKLAGGNGLNIFFGKGKVHYQWAQRQTTEEPTDFMDRGTAEEIEKLYSRSVEMYRMDVELIGANQNAEVITEDRQAFFERYFLSWVNKDNSNEGVRANAYKKITYKNIYPHIDWVFYFNKKGQLEHDFIVHPGGKVADIQMKYSGSTNLKLNADGSLTAHCPMGTITENAPYSMEQSGKEVASNFKLENGVLSFAVAAYSGTLIIDPILEWGTYFGGSDDETSYALTTDKWGSVYMTGSTGSLSNIVTTGAHQTTYGGGTNAYGADAFLSKWNMDGDLLWATYYGGDKVDVAKGVGCDTMGNVYIGGYTKSTVGISTTGSHQDIKAGNAARNDAFLIKFDSAGIRSWGTYFGGTNDEASTSMAMTCDQSNSVYLTGTTLSTSDIATPNAYQTAIGGGIDGFLAKFNTNGNLTWATYYGGSSSDYPTSLTTDSLENVYITGYTISTNGISTSTSYQTNNAGNDDAFVSKFDNNGQLIWGTYFGGTSQDRGYVISNNNNNIYIAGITQSLSGIATIGSFQGNFAGGIGGDAFLANFDENGNLGWCTYYGGENAEAVGGIFANEIGEIYLSGQTQSLNNIATIESYQENLSGISDIFLVKFNALGERQWGTYLGSTDVESFGFLTGDNNANLYLSGHTNGAVNIATNNAYQSNLNGGYDAFLVRFNDCEAPDLPSTIAGAIEVCAHSEQIYSVNNNLDAVSYAWLLPQGWIGSSDSNSIHVTVGNDDGVIQVMVFSACGGVSDTQSLAITVLPIPEPVVVNNSNVLSTTQSYSAYQWNKNGVAIPNANQGTFLVNENGSYSVKVSNNNSCEHTSDDVIITDIVGISEFNQAQDLIIYPNPVQEFLNIESVQSGNAVLLSIEGKILLSKTEIQKGVNTISLKGISSGIYFLKIVSQQNQIQIIKIVKE